jgi:hypothetical protein
MSSPQPSDEHVFPWRWWRRIISPLLAAWIAPVNNFVSPTVYYTILGSALILVMCALVAYLIQYRNSQSESTARSLCICGERYE